MKVSQTISELLYPSGIKCIICGDELPKHTPYCVCDRCELERNNTFCLHCGRPIPPMNAVCCACHQSTDNFTKARSVFAYNGNSARLIKRLKYAGAKYLARPMAEFMADIYHESDFDCAYITFVPIHGKRLHSRGYNQAELLADQLSEIVGIPVVKLLRKTVYTKNMARLNRKQRAELITNTFAFDGSVDLRKKSVLLVDDVLTTGATANECAKVLLKHYAGEVNVLTFASTKSKEFLIFQKQLKQKRIFRTRKRGNKDS